jgi:hypothetical protein
MKKKISAKEFTSGIQTHLDSFLVDMTDQRFSDRNETEWTKLLLDYLGLTNFQKDEPDDSDFLA